MAEPDSLAPDRRRLLGMCLACTPIAWASALATRLLLTPAQTEQPSKIGLGNAADVPKTGIVARAVAFTIRRGPAVEDVARVVYLSRDDGGKIYALSGECPHMRCPVTLAADSKAPFLCRCHGGSFAADGTVLDGPPARPLERLELELPADETGEIHWVLS